MSGLSGRPTSTRCTTPMNRVHWGPRLREWDVGHGSKSNLEVEEVAEFDEELAADGIGWRAITTPALG